MRNLKKILALVLALVMSLSLMATASAADATAENGNPNYQTSADVLLKLGVVKGDAGTGAVRPTDNITRAEVAALLYRIATGDVNDTQAGIHTREPFDDVFAGDWYTGYISYCYIAEIIKGNPDNTFEPNEDINGYATLAMILRAMGYGKKGEFVGDGWEIRTASIAKQIGILEGITDTQLSGAAKRELVFEILFRAILKDTVRYNALYEDYDPTGETLGQQMFGLEQITGVVKANEWANLEGAKILPEGTTKMTVSSVEPANGTVAQVGQDITLNTSSPLEVVGLTCVAYVQNGTDNNSKIVLTDLVKSDVNVDNDNNGGGVATGLADQSYKTIKDLANGLDLADALYFVNYDESLNEHAQSKDLIRYAIAKDSVTDYDKENGTAWAKFLADEKADTRTIKVPKADGSNETETVECWLRTIRPGNEIKGTDLDIMQEIFYSADRIGDTTVNDGGALKDYVIGEVYVRTTSMKDISDEMNWDDFCDNFLTFDKVLPYTTCEKGNSLRIIDNNGDGKAEYVLKVEYTQTKAVDTFKGELAFLGGLKMADYEGNTLYNPNELSKDNMGVVVNYTVIDKKLSIWEAEKLTDTIKAKSYKDITVTTTEGGETLNQSYIENDTGLDENIMTLPEKVLYNMYLDQYRNIRSFELAGEKQYALVTEVYYNGTQNWNYVKTNDFVVEAVLNGEETGPVAVNEYPGSKPGVFFSADNTNAGYAWTSRNTRYNPSTDLNFLQPATAHLGIANESIYEGSTTGTAPLYRDVRWSRNVFQAATITSGDHRNGTIGVFNYGNVSYSSASQTYTPWVGGDVDPTNSNGSFSYTNVANYVESDNALSLTTASKVFHNQNGDEVYRASTKITVSGKDVDAYTAMTAGEWADWYTEVNKTATSFQSWWNSQLSTGAIYLVYATDYVQLITSNDTEMWNTNGRHFQINDNYDIRYRALSNSYVNTVDETIFYIATPNKVYRQVGFENFISFLKTVNRNGTLYANGNVRAAYAVAQNTRKDANGQDYWVADVVVLEVYSLGYTYDSIALMYYNPNEDSGNVQNVNSLDNEWVDLQPEYEHKAMMTISDKGSSWANRSWGNGQYGFYGIVDQELVTDGEMTASSIERIPFGAYNYNGIYAGTVRRDRTVVDSRYIDVELVGKTYTYAGASDPYRVKYDEWNTPVYRIVRNAFDTTAEELYLTNWEPTDQVEDGDRVIVVMGSDGVAFIVDLGPDSLAKVGIKAVQYNIPSWLDQQWWMIAIEQTYTNGSNANDISKTIVAPTEAAVAALESAIQNETALSNPVAKKIANIFLGLASTSGDIANTDVAKLTVSDVEDILAGLIGAYWTVGTKAEQDAVTRAEANAELAAAIIEARTRINAIKTAAVAAEDAETVALADAALAALKDAEVDTPAEAKAIADALEEAINGETPETPTEPGKYTVSIMVSGAAAPTGWSITPATANDTVPNKLTITAPVGTNLPANNSTPDVYVTINGANYTSFTYNRTAGKLNEAVIAFNNGGIANFDNITVNVTGGTSTVTAQDVTVVATNASASDAPVSGITVTPKVYAGDYLTSLTVTGIPTGMYVGPDATDVKFSTDNGSNDVAMAKYTYDRETNVLTFKADSNVAAGTGANNKLTLKLYQDVTVTLAGTGAENVVLGTTSLVKGKAITSLNIQAKPGYKINNITIADTATSATTPSMNTAGTAATFTSWTPASNVTVTVTTQEVVSVKMSDDSVGLVVTTPSGNQAVKGSTLDANNLVIGFADGYTSANWALPTTATVKVNGTPYSATVSSGKITLTGAGAPSTFTGDVVVTASAVRVYAVTKDLTDLTATGIGATVAEGTDLGDVTITLAVASGKEATNDLPAKSGITITMMDNGVSKPVAFGYEAGAITFAEDTWVTGDITITAAAPTK